MANRDIARHFDFEPAGRRLEDLETPVPVIDLDKKVHGTLMPYMQTAHAPVFNHNRVIQIS